MIPIHLRPVIQDLLENKKYSAALDMLDTAFGTTPDDPETLAMMALVHCYLGNYDASDRLLNKALDTPTPPTFEVFWAAATIYRVSKRFDRAIAICQHIIQCDAPGSPYFGWPHFEPGNDIAHVKSCINDCRYMLSDTFYMLDKMHLAENYGKAYLRHLEEGIDTRFDPDMLWGEHL